MISAKQTPEEELPRAIAEALGWEYISTKHAPKYGRWFNNGKYVISEPWWDPVHKLDQFYELAGDPETHAKICDVLDEWFSQESFYTNGAPSVDTPYSSKVEVYEGPGDMKLNPGWKWYKNPAYLTENGGWRAWWLRALLEITRNEK